jgi:hypothetical protein
MKDLIISNKEYRAREGVSSTDLKKIAKSPAHFRYWKDNPEESTPALLFGRAVHKYVLEKDKFTEEFAVAPEVNRRAKEVVTHRHNMNFHLLISNYQKKRYTDCLKELLILHDRKCTKWVIQTIIVLDV